MNNKSSLAPKLEWDNSKKKYIVGETIVATIYIKNLKKAKAISNYKFTFNFKKNYSVKEIDNIGKNQVENIKGKKFIKVPIKSFLLSFLNPGEVYMPIVTVNYKGIKIKSSNKKINIVKYDSKNSAVGDFLIKKEIKSKKFVQSRNLELKIKLEGVGNFENLKFPNVKTKKLSLIKKSKKTLLFYSKDGLKGYIEYDFIYEMLETGEGRIEIEEFEYIKNFKKEKIKIDDFKFKIKSILSELDSKLFKIFSEKEILDTKNNSFNYYLNYLYILVYCLFFISALICLTKKRKVSNIILYTIVILFFSCEKGIFLKQNNKYN